MFLSVLQCTLKTEEWIKSKRFWLSGHTIFVQVLSCLHFWSKSHQCINWTSKVMRIMVLQYLKSVLVLIEWEFTIFNSILPSKLYRNTWGFGFRVFFWSASKEWLVRGKCELPATWCFLWTDYQWPADEPRSPTDRRWVTLGRLWIMYNQNTNKCVKAGDHQQASFSEWLAGCALTKWSQILYTQPLIYLSTAET